LQQTLRNLKVEMLIVDHRSLQGLLDSYEVVGERFGIEILKFAKLKRKKLQDDLDVFAEKAKGHKPVRTLVCIDRSRGTGKIQNLFVAGAGSFLNDVLKLAGGENVAEPIGMLAPSISAEGIIDLAPDVILDLQIGDMNIKQSEAEWRTLGNQVPAVKNNRIYLITDDFATIPGPRIPILIEKFARLMSE
jgi:iron complex transport system substrate-binding protein